MSEICQLMKEVNDFVTERDWGQFHTPENLAKSISIEAAELLECYQWSPEADMEAVMAAAKKACEVFFPASFISSAIP